MSDQATDKSTPPSFRITIVREHRNLTIVAMATGILIAIPATVICEALVLDSNPQGLLLAAPIGAIGLTLITVQYLGVTRGHRFALQTSNLILLAISAGLFVLALLNPLVLLLVWALLATVKMNRDHLIAVDAAERVGLLPSRRTSLTLTELMGAFVVLALIFGPASLITRWFEFY